MYVFGGCTSSFTTFNDLLRLDLATRKWTRPVPEQHSEFYGYPRPKAGASLVADERENRLIIFGGWKPEPSPTFRVKLKFNFEIIQFFVTRNAQLY